MECAVSEFILSGLACSVGWLATGAFFPVFASLINDFL
jgi:hypothetical protein